MLTRCPRCNTSFRVLAEHLKAAHGRVQCGRCYIQFDALECLFDEEPDAVPRLQERSEAAPPATPVPPSPAADTSPPELPAEFPFESGTGRVDEAREIPIGDLDSLETPVADRAGGPRVSTTASPADRPIGMEAVDVLLQDFTEPVISRERIDEELIASQMQPSRGTASALWGVAAAILVLAGAGQYAWYQRDALMRQFPALRPLYEGLCERAGCELKPERDLEAIKVLARDVRDHPRFKDSLLVNATLENQADFPQPYPLIELSLYDAGGRMIGVRRFLPEEYLDSSVAVREGMPPHQPVYIVLEIARPAEEAVSFEFKFY